MMGTQVLPVGSIETRAVTAGMGRNELALVINADNAPGVDYLNGLFRRTVYSL